MKDLSTYLECDGCATPGSVVGMGNPAAPDGDTPGSGDTFDHQKKTTKAKRRKKDVQTDDKKHQESIVQPTQEGLLDDDFGMTDEFDHVLVDSYLDQYAQFLQRETEPTKQQFETFYAGFEACAQVMHGATAGSTSLMKAFRSKDYTMISFKQKGDTKAIEIRKFVKNPLPYSYNLEWFGSYINSNKSGRTNHPTALNMKMWRPYICPADIWDKLQSRLNGYWKIR